MGRDKPPKGPGGGRAQPSHRGNTAQAAAKKGGAPGQPAAAPADPPQPQWASWVPGVTWLDENLWDKRIPKEIVQKYRPCGTAGSGGRAKLARPGRIMDPAHPAFRQFGLFAAKRLDPGTHVLDYRGLVTLEAHESKTSDYTLTFADGGPARLTLDAATCGNEGRFANDFRGTGKKANVKFQERWDERGCMHMGIYVLPGVTVPKGAELLLSYGKGYWLARLGYKEGEGAEEGAEEAEEAAPEDEAAPGGDGGGPSSSGCGGDGGGESGRREGAHPLPEEASCSATGASESGGATAAAGASPPVVVTEEKERDGEAQQMGADEEAKGQRRREGGGAAGAGGGRKP